MTSQELSEFIGVAVKTLANWRSQAVGPKYVKPGGRVRYRLSDVEQWLISREYGSEAA
jgi:predicted DNA-binding transcriptional regulator AlpA